MNVDELTLRLNASVFFENFTISSSSIENISFLSQEKCTYTWREYRKSISVEKSKNDLLPAKVDKFESALLPKFR